jgi:hypothetical protein
MRLLEGCSGRTKKEKIHRYLLHVLTLRIMQTFEVRPLKLMNRANKLTPSGDQYWSDEFWETFEDSVLIPELTLTAPTPEMTTSVKFRSERSSELSCEGGLEHQVPEANAYRPSRLGYTTPLASFSEALGTGADMLLGAGEGIFDATGLNSGGILQLAASGHADDLLDSLAVQPLSKSQTETGFLGQLLRRKSTGRSQISERRDRVWKRVSHVLRSSWRSSGSARDQEKIAAFALADPLNGSHAANEPLNARHGWKRFSHILENAMRRWSAGDQVPFTEPVDPLEGAHSGFSEFGSTRRHGLDIPADSVDHIEHWHGSLSGRPAYINEKHAATHLDRPTLTVRENVVISGNWYRKFFEGDSFGLLGKRIISRRRWRISAEGPGTSWSTEDERIRNGFERHTVAY